MSPRCRRSADYYITVQRRGGNSTNCSYGLSLGSIEGALGVGSDGTDQSASCTFLGLLPPASIGASTANATRVPWCSTVMPPTPPP